MMKRSEAAIRGLQYKKDVLKNFAVFTGKHLRWSLFVIKLEALQLFYKEAPTQVFSCEYCKFFKDTNLKNIYKWMLLNINVIVLFNQVFCLFFVLLIYNFHFHFQ